MRIALPFLGSAVTLPLLLGQPASAQIALSSEPKITLDAEVKVEMDLDMLGRRRGQPAYSDLYTKSELSTALNLPSGFAINGTFALEPAGREVTGKDRYFAHHAGYVEELYLSWTRGPLELYAGKIHPSFGFAWEKAPGIYGNDFALGYELEQKLGAGAAVNWAEWLGLDEAFGQNYIRAEVFKDDTSFLSSSLGAARWQDGAGYRYRNRRRLGGADNTGGYTNYVLSAQGEKLRVPGGALEYNLGYSYRQPGQDSLDQGTAAGEHGYIAGFAWRIGPEDGTNLTPMVEWLRLENADAIRDLRRDVATVGLALQHGALNLSYAYNWQRDAARGARAESADEHTASIGYDLEAVAPWLKGFEGSLGWRRLRESGDAADDFGVQVVYRYKF